mgnify:CR=1 FL=1
MHLTPKLPQENLLFDQPLDFFVRDTVLVDDVELVSSIERVTLGIHGKVLLLLKLIKKTRDFRFIGITD